MEIGAKYRWIVAFLGVVLVVFLVWYFRTIVFYILAAMVVSLIGRPIIKAIELISIRGVKIPRWLSAIIALLVLIGIFAGLGFLLVPVVVDKLHFFASLNASQLNEILRGPAWELESWVESTFPMSNFSIQDIVASKIIPLFNSGFVRETLTGISSFIVNASIALFSISFITYFFLKDDKLFNEGVVTLFPKKFEQNILRAISSSINLLMRYFIGICIESLIKLTVVSLSLYILGMEFSTALIIGIVTSVLNVIPYIGPIVGGVFAVIIAAMSPVVAGVTLGGIVIEIVVVLLIFQLIDNIILQPYIYSSSVKAHPLEIFIVILMAGYIAGITGMLLAIPTYTVLRVFAKEFFNNMRVVQKLTEKL